MNDLIERLRERRMLICDAAGKPKGISATPDSDCAEAADYIEYLTAERDALREDAERWRKAVSSYERGVLMSRDGRTGEKDGYISLFLQAINERDAARKDAQP